MQKESPQNPVKDPAVPRLVLHFLIIADYAAGAALLLAAARERWDLARDTWLCAALMTSFAMALLAAIFRSKKRFHPLFPWVFALIGLAAALSALLLRLNW